MNIWKISLSNIFHKPLYALLSVLSLSISISLLLGIQQLERRALDADSDPAELKDRIVALSSTLQGQIDLLSRIAAEFSTLARLPQGELLALSLKRLLEEVVLLHGVEGVGPTLRCDGDIEVEGDADQLKRLFSNLIINAQQAIGDGPGKVWVVLDASEQCIVVKDSGPGMTKEVADRVFEPRFTTRGGGSGLGLAMVKAICTPPCNGVRNPA